MVDRNPFAPVVRVPVAQMLTVGERIAAGDLGAKIAVEIVSAAKDRGLRWELADQFTDAVIAEVMRLRAVARDIIRAADQAEARP